MDTVNTQRQTLKFGFYTSLLMVMLTMVTFGFAMIAVPPAGPYCTGNCMDYPYSDILSYYPRDYYWMYLAIFQLFTYLIFIVYNHFIAPTGKKLYSLISIAFASISSTVLLITYFTQFSVVPMSMMKGEAEGIALLTQYNGHGLFIALEELGYIAMSISFLFLAPVFSAKSKMEKSVRAILIIQFILTLLAFIAYSIKFGPDRSYRFEVAVISVNWLDMIAIGILLSIVIKRKIRYLAASAKL